MADLRGQWKTGKNGRRKKNGCKITCGAPTTLVVKGLMMMMMMMAGEMLAAAGDWGG